MGNATALAKDCGAQLVKLMALWDTCAQRREHLHLVLQVSSEGGLRRAEDKTMKKTKVEKYGDMIHIPQPSSRGQLTTERSVLAKSRPVHSTGSSSVFAKA